MATPQFVIDNVYTQIYSFGSPFPPPLPFERSLELKRLHFQKLDLRIPDAMVALRSGSLFSVWTWIFPEQLGINQGEFGLLLMRDVDKLYGSPPGGISALSNVQYFCRRVGVTYEELTSILGTRFINPSAVLIPRLRRLGVPFRTLHALNNGTMEDDVFIALLPADLDARKYGGKDITDFQAVAKWVKDSTNYDRIKRLIVIDVPPDATDPGSAAPLNLCFCNPSDYKLHDIDFIRLMRFIRLWKKLGFTIAQTDDIISALYPKEFLPLGQNDAVDLDRLGEGFQYNLLPRIALLLQIIDRLKLIADRDLASLLTCWANIGTVGEKSLYAKMFLSPGIGMRDSAFADDGYGNVLQDQNETMLDHAPALCAAFKLSKDDLLRLTAGEAQWPLDLGLISYIYRRAWLRTRFDSVSLNSFRSPG